MKDTMFTVRLACPTCGRSGTAHFEAAHGVTPRRLSELSEGFLGIDAGSHDGPRLVCQKCRTLADEQPV